MNKKNNTKQRRGFLKILLSAIVGLGLIKLSQKKPLKTEGKKIKMLTPEGKLVEIDEENYLQIASTQPRATNKEVQDWMKTSKI